MYLTTGDTLAIVNDYMLTKVFSGKFSKDSVNLTWEDSISHNKSLSHTFTVQNLRPTLLKETITNKRKLYLGGSIGWSLNTQLPTLSPTGVYIDKQERAFIASYDIINRTTQMGIALKIHL